MLEASDRREDLRVPIRGFRLPFTMTRNIFRLTAFGALLLQLAFTACSGTGDHKGNVAQTASPVTASNPSSQPSAVPAENAPAGAADAAASMPPPDVVRVEAPSVELRPGEAEEVAVRLDIADGYHVNANPATGKYQIATELRVEADGGQLKPGAPKYPAGVVKKFAFASEPLAVYENEATIRLPLRAASDAQRGEHTLRARVRVQPCDDRVCYPPRWVEASLLVTVN